MGKSASKPSASVSGDKDLTIINNQEIHRDFHEDHALKLNIILVLVTIQLVFVIYKIWYKRIQKKTILRVKSMADLDKV